MYSYGHRNPQGLAWQPGTRRLHETEHGPSGSAQCCRDEVNYIEPGRNHGWPIISGDEAREVWTAPRRRRGADGALYILTSNRDRRGSPAPDDDRVIRLTVR